MSFTTQLKKHRLELHMTQKEMAEALGISLLTYRNWELGTTTITLRQLLRICEVLKITLIELIV